MCPCVFHLRCLDPPLDAIPPGKWFCSSCNMLLQLQEIERILGMRTRSLVSPPYCHLFACLAMAFKCKCKLGVIWPLQVPGSKEDVTSLGTMGPSDGFVTARLGAHVEGVAKRKRKRGEEDEYLCSQQISSQPARAARKSTKNHQRVSSEQAGSTAAQHCADNGRRASTSRRISLPPLLSTTIASSPTSCAPTELPRPEELHPPTTDKTVSTPCAVVAEVACGPEQYVSVNGQRHHVSGTAPSRAPATSSGVPSNPTFAEHRKATTDSDSEDVDVVSAMGGSFDPPSSISLQVQQPSQLESERRAHHTEPDQASPESSCLGPLRTPATLVCARVTHFPQQATAKRCKSGASSFSILSCPTRDAIPSETCAPTSNERATEQQEQCAAVKPLRGANTTAVHNPATDRATPSSAAALAGN